MCIRDSDCTVLAMYEGAWLRVSGPTATVTGRARVFHRSGCEVFEDGLDVSDASVLQRLLDELGIDEPTDDDRGAVRNDYADGQRRGVAGSPHFFTADGSFFCPSLDIEHDEAGYEVSFDAAGFQAFVASAFA